MAVKKKLIKNQETPVKCSVCGEKKAIHTIHGVGTGFWCKTDKLRSYVHGGVTICEDCYIPVKKQAEEYLQKELNYEPSEADYQTWWNL